MAGNTSTVQIEIQVDDKGGVKVLRQIGAESEKAGKKGEKSFKGMARSVGDFNKRIASTQGLFLKLGAGIATAALAAKLKGVIDVASDLNETMSKSEAIFDTQAAAIQAWALRSATSLGMSTQAALEHTATLGNMFDQLGAGTDIAAKSSMQMVKLAADIASFHNVVGGASAVLEAMASSFRGEYDALQRYIPTINAAAVQEQALIMTHKANARELTNLEKALAAQAIIMRGAGAAVGDFERTSGGLANQQRILEANIKNLEALLGQQFLPTATRIVTEINNWILVNDALIKQKVPEYIDRLESAVSGLYDLGKHISAQTAGWGLVGWMLGGPAGALGLGYTSIKLNEINDELERTGKVAKDVGAITLWDRIKGWMKEEEVKVPVKFYPMPVDTTSQDLNKKILSKKHPLSGTGKTELGAELQAYYGMWSAYGDAMEEFYTTNSKVYLDTTISDIEKSKDVYAAMYSDLKFQSDTYYAYQLEQLENQAADYESYTGDTALAHLWLTEQIKALDKERLSAAQKNNQFLIDLSERTSDAMEHNFSRFYRDFFRGELDSTADYFRAFCNSLSDSFSDMLGQMTKEMLFGGGSSGGKGFFGSLFSGMGGFFRGGTSLDASAGLGADWSATLWHGGGRVGKDPAPTRTVPASVFANAPRLHGGWPGLQKDEFPSILKYDETVLPSGVKPVNNVSNLTISVPVSIEGQGDDRLASKLSYEVEETVRRVLREEMR